MPLFFITAGYFAKKTEVFLYVKKSFYRLILPYLFTASVLIVYNYIRCFIKQDFQFSIFQYLLSWLCGYGFNYSDNLMSFGALWFLTAIFCSNNILNIMLNNFKSTKTLIVASISVCIFGIVISKFVCLPFNLDIGMYAVIFECFGYLLKKYDIEYSKVILVLMATLGYLGGLYVYAYDLNTRQYTYPLISTIGALGGSFLFLILCQQLEKWELLNCFLSRCGRNSLTILCLHILEHSIVPWSKVPLLYNRYFLLVTVKIVLIVLGVMIIMRIPVINKIYGYKDIK